MKELGYTVVPCEVTKRYLKVSKISHNATGSELIAITLNQPDEVCCLFVKKVDMLKALEGVRVISVFDNKV